MAFSKKWQPSYVHGICIGIEQVDNSVEGGKYSRMILNTILPDTDEEYEQQKEEIEGTVKLVCKLYNQNLKS